VEQEADVQTPVPERPQADERFALSPNESRFLFVEVAAQRAKQLRRGALNRLAPVSEAGSPETPLPQHKPERVAMEEVRRGFIRYGLDEEPAAEPKTGEDS
jgi:DNA-directed RNA polymerase subunit K/omega